MRDTNIEKIKTSNEKLVYNRLQELWAYKEHSNLLVKDIWKWIVLVERDWNIKRYYKVENWKVGFLFNPDDVRKLFDFNTVIKLMGHKEINENGIFNMYSIKNTGKETWKSKLWVKPINIYSEDYFNIWKNAIFFARKIHLEQWKNLSTEWDYHKITEDDIRYGIKHWVIRIRDLKLFKDRSQISKPLFDKYLPALKKLLYSQILDTRFNLVRDPVSEQEIHDYIAQWLISKDFAIKSWVLRLRDLVKYKEEWLIDDATIKKYWPVLWKMLLKQIWDVRFDFINNPITEGEIHDYLKAQYITKDFARKCYFKLQKVEKMKEEKAIKKQNILSESQIWIKDIQFA